MPEEIADKIHHTFSQYPMRRYPKGQILVFADESPEHIYYLTKGRVIQYDVSYKGDEVIVNTYKPRAFFPLAWAINRHHNAYFYKTVEPTELHIVPADDVVRFLQDNPDVLYNLVERVYRGIDGMLARMVQLMSGTAKSRLIHELVIEARRFGVLRDDGSYQINLTETDLAARAGLSRETVNREMHKLKQANLLHHDKSKTVITDIRGLKHAAD